MDFVRRGSTRRVNMRFYRDDLSIEVPVEWYYVPDTRPAVPYGHPFISRDWEDVTELELLGEVSGTRSYYNGNHADDLQGLGLCGSREQWERGASTLDPVRPINPTTGRQCCCGPGSLQVPPAVVFGLESEVIPVPTITTCSLFNPSPAQWTMTVAGTTNGTCVNCNNANGTFILNYVSGCRWASAPFALCGGASSWILDVGVPAGQASLQVLGSPVLPTQRVLYRKNLAGWQPFGPNGMIFVQRGLQCNNWPVSITLNAVP